MDVDEVITALFISSALVLLQCGLIFIPNALIQVECIVAILIYKNLIKGYFAHKSKVVVLSKQDPFPKLNGKPVGL